MRFTQPVESWVVYQAIAKRGGGRAMCPDSEWPALEAAGHTLIQSGIANEGAAERLARGTSGDTKPRGINGPLVRSRLTPSSGSIILPA